MRTLKILSKCTSSSQGRRSKQEDAVCCHSVLLHDWKCNDETKPELDSTLKSLGSESHHVQILLAGVFDGHGGPEVATIASNALEFSLLKCLRSSSDHHQHLPLSAASLRTALSSALLEIDLKLFKEGEEQRMIKCRCDKEDARRAQHHPSSLLSTAFQRNTLNHWVENDRQEENKDRLQDLVSDEDDSTINGPQKKPHRSLAFEDEDDVADIPVCSPNYYPYIRDHRPGWECEDCMPAQTSGIKKMSIQSSSDNKIAGTPPSKSPQNEIEDDKSDQRRLTIGLFSEDDLLTNQTVQQTPPIRASYDSIVGGLNGSKVKLNTPFKEEHIESQVRERQKLLSIDSNTKEQRKNSHFIRPPPLPLGSRSSISVTTIPRQGNNLKSLLSLSTSPTTAFSGGFGFGRTLSIPQRNASGLTSPGGHFLHPPLLAVPLVGEQSFTYLPLSPLSNSTSIYPNDLRQPRTMFDHVGSTVTASVITDHCIVNATLGDSKTILLRFTRKPQSLIGELPAIGTDSRWLKECTDLVFSTPQHRLDLPEELERLRAFHQSEQFRNFLLAHPSHLREARGWADMSGSSFTSNPRHPTPQPDFPFEALVADNRLLGQLNVSRGLGDFSLKCIPKTFHDSSSVDKHLLNGGLDNVDSIALISSDNINDLPLIGPMGNISSIQCYEAVKDLCEGPTQEISPSILFLLSASDGLWDCLGINAPKDVFVETSNRAAYPKNDSDDDDDDDNSRNAWDEHPPFPSSCRFADKAVEDLLEFLSGNASFTQFLHEEWDNIDSLNKFKNESDESSSHGETSADLGQNKTDNEVCGLTDAKPISHRPSTSGTPTTPKLTDKSFPLTPRKTSTLQKVADDLVYWAIHDRNSADNTSVVIVAIEERSANN